MQLKALFDLEQPSNRYKWMVLSRVFAAIFAGYLAASLITIALSLLLLRIGFADSQAVLSATLPSFLVYSMIVIFIFSCKSLKKIWFFLIGLITFASMLILMFRS